MKIIKFENESVLEFKNLADGDVFCIMGDEKVLIRLSATYGEIKNAVNLYTGQTYCIDDNCDVVKYPNARVVLY